METTTTNTASNVGTSNLNKPLGAAPAESMHAATRPQDTVDRVYGLDAFPTRAEDAEREGPTSLETKVEDFLSSQDWAEAARKEVREHPLAVVGVALVAGLLIGRL